MSGKADETIAVPVRPEVMLREAIADLNDLATFGELDDDARIELASQIRALVGASYEDPAGVPGGHESWRAYSDRSPFTGRNNPRAPGLRMRVEPESDPPTAVGTVSVGPAFAGPPGFVHGGIVAGLFDEAIGWLASATEPQAPVVTGRLNVRFRSPTPIGQPLRFTVTVTRHTRRSLSLEAVCEADGRRCATCDALMVIAR